MLLGKRYLCRQFYKLGGGIRSGMSAFYSQKEYILCLSPCGTLPYLMTRKDIHPAVMERGPPERAQAISACAARAAPSVCDSSAATRCAAFA